MAGYILSCIIIVGGNQMALIFNFEKLGELLNSLYLITNRKITLKDDNFNDVITSNTACEFCKLIQSMPHGLTLCQQCDMRALTHVREKNRLHIYRCHAGLIEVAVPVMEKGQLLAYLMYGQVLDDSSLEEQWTIVAQRCKWHDNLSALHDAFHKLDQLERSTLLAYADVLSACASFIWLREYVKQTELDEPQLILSYIDKNHMRPLTLRTISSELGIGRTKLCETARKAFSCSIHDLILLRRIDSAKKLLTTSDLTIGQIAESVGMNDCSYFVKVFKTATGYTPSKYRKHGDADKELDNNMPATTEYMNLMKTEGDLLDNHL